MSSLTIREIKKRIESTFPELAIGWSEVDGKPRIINKKNGIIIAYTHHGKWILKASVSDYSNHIGAIISLLEQWDGKS